MISAAVTDPLCGKAVFSEPLKEKYRYWLKWQISFYIRILDDWCFLACTGSRFTWCLLKRVNMSGSRTLRAKGADWRLQISPRWECVCLEWRPVQGVFLQKWLEPQTILNEPFGSPLTRLLDFTANENSGLPADSERQLLTETMDRDMEAMLAKAEVLILLF